jgi:diguanylate cyclase (GGDEF)-like protein
MVARVLIQTLKRTSDIAARWGGEEFAVLLPNADYSGGLEVAEQIRRNVEASEVPYDDGDITKLTVSIGVNAHTPTITCPIDDFFLGTDKALYYAKNTGRNRVCLYE